ncbi:MAG: molybdopterin converting factor subunit 1 [Anaerolineae bacterium]|nr:molybdopterin converting factor subunit 1 [Anaerolineae bacterium]
MTDTITVRVRAFAALREALGTAESTITLPAGADVQALIAALAARHPQARLTERRFGVALNRNFAPPTATLADGDEVALLPPVSGGTAMTDEAPAADTCVVEITNRPLSLDAVLRRIVAAERGGVTFFAGTVRGITRPADGTAGEIATAYLEYEAYPEMAVEALRRIADEVRTHWPDIAAVHIVHRVGRLEVGDVAVIVAVAAAHRRHTFDACRYAIDRIKQIAPIWKKEVGPDGATWVEGPESVVEASRSVAVE